MKKGVTHLSVWMKGGIGIGQYGIVIEDHRSCEKKLFFKGAKKYKNYWSKVVETRKGKHWNSSNYQRSNNKSRCKS